MILINYPQDSKEIDGWKSRLERMTVAHTLIQTSDLEPSLKEGNTLVYGIIAINLFLDQYEKDVKSWNQDRCDMWFFEESD